MKNCSVLHPYKTTSKCAVKYVFVLIKLCFAVENDIVSGFEALEASHGLQEAKKALYDLG